MFTFRDLYAYYINTRCCALPQKVDETVDVVRGSRMDRYRKVRHVDFDLRTATSGDNGKQNAE